MAVTKKSLISSTPKKATSKSIPKASGPAAAAKLKTASAVMAKQVNFLSAKVL